MPKYRLIYFNARGYGEIARLVFAQAGVEYEDVRFEQDGWPEYKKKMPFGQAPVLEVDGQQISDSCVIARYLAKEFGLAGKDRAQEAQVDSYVAAAYDLVRPCGPIFSAAEDKKAELLKKFIEETVPKFLDRFEATLGANKSGFLIGDGLTYADLTVFHFMTFVSKMLPADVNAKYPNVQKHGKKIESLPKIAAWIKKRPVTEN